MNQLGFTMNQINHLVKKGLPTMDRQEAVDQLSYLQNELKFKLIEESKA